MSLTGFLTGIGSLFAGAGGDKSKTSATGTSTEKATGTSKTANVQNSTGTQVQTGLTGTSQQSKQSTDTKQNTNQSGTSNTQQTAAEKSKQNQVTTTYSSDVLASLDSLLKSQLASGTSEQATDAVAGRLEQVQADAAGPQFDVGNYVSGIAAAAGAATQSDLDSRINEILSATGTSETGNSMSALLGNRLRNEAAANLAGIVSNATATGNQIRQQESANTTGQINDLTGNLNAQLNSLLGVAQGGRQETVNVGENTTEQLSKTQDTAQQSTVGSENTSATASGYESSRLIDKTNQTVSGVQTQQQSQTGTKTGTENSNTKSGGGVDGIFSNLFTALSKSAAIA